MRSKIWNCRVRFGKKIDFGSYHVEGLLPTGQPCVVLRNVVLTTTLILFKQEMNLAPI